MNMKVIVATLLFPVLANAGMGSVMQNLMNEPATLLDVGMVRLAILTTEFKERVGLHWTTEEGEKEFFQAEVNSRYEPDDDRVYVSFLIMNSEATQTQMEEGCGNAMRQMGYWLGKSLPGLFSHVGRVDQSDTQRLHKAFQELVVLRCYVSSGRDTSVGRFWASRSLADPELTRPMGPVVDPLMTESTSNQA